MPRVAPLVAVLVVVAACAPAPATIPSSAEPSASGASVSQSLPEGCEPIDMRSPSGDRIDLTGEWAGSGAVVESGETTWMIQLGDCVYGSVMDVDFLADPRSPDRGLTTLSGRIGSDYRIDVEVVIIAQPPIRMSAYSSMELIIEWDEEDGRIRLREDREPGASAARCVVIHLPCPDPMIWYRVDDLPAPT